MKEIIEKREEKKNKKNARTKNKSKIGIKRKKLRKKTTNIQ